MPIWDTDQWSWRGLTEYRYLVARHGRIVYRTSDLGEAGWVADRIGGYVIER